jgi:hypothetical protein
MVFKFVQIPPEIWVSIPLEAKIQLLNDMQRHQQEDERMKIFFALSETKAVNDDKKINESNM